MIKWLMWWSIAAVTVLAAACSKDEKAGLTVNMQLTADGIEISKGQISYHPQGFSFRVDEFKLYVSNVRLADNQGNVVPLKMQDTPGAKEGVFLFWWGKESSFKGTIPPGQYIKILFDIGLRPALNDLDPNQFPREHPLSRNTDMYWDMLKYRFLTFEGVADPKNNGSFDLFFSYHLGGDDFLREAEIPINLTAEDGQSADANVRIDVPKIFSNSTGSIDITTFFSYHSQETGKENGLKMMDFLQTSME